MEGTTFKYCHDMLTLNNSKRKIITGKAKRSSTSLLKLKIFLLKYSSESRIKYNIIVLTGTKALKSTSTIQLYQELSTTFVSYLIFNNISTSKQNVIC